MKKAFVIIFAVLLAAILTVTIVLMRYRSDKNDISEDETTPAQGEVADTPKDEPNELSESIELQITDLVIDTSTTVIHTYWVNNSDQDVIYGDPYTIQREENGKWVDCEALPPGFSFYLLGHILSPGDSQRKEYGLCDSFDVSVPGKYRIATDCIVSEAGTSKRTQLDIFSEFTVESTDNTHYSTEYEITEADLIITKIYPDCFFAAYVIPLANEIKLNGILSDEWCVGDKVHVTFKHYRYYDKLNREEADLITIDESDFEPDPDMAYKPVIYLYPEKETDVTVKLTLDGRLTCTYPEYGSGWHVSAAPDGTLTDNEGKKYNYLYWEGETRAEYDFSKGFCVKGENTAEFLEDALAKLGLDRREANEFIVYWLPMMQDNPYNVISFQTDAYTDSAKLDITPEPDTLIRVFMAWYGSEEFTPIEPQALNSPERSGFTVIEWGGSRVGR